MAKQNSASKHDTVVDMSPAAIDRRLRTVGELFRFGMALRSAKRIGVVSATDRKESPHGNKLGKARDKMREE